MAVEVALFRIVQECLSNIRKHAKASHVMIKTEILPGKTNLVIKDNGIGFNLDQLKFPGKKECFGILGMRERTQILKGEFTVNSSPGQGTSISISVPVED